MTTPVSLKQLAEGKAEGVQKATYFKISPDVIEFEDGFNLREEGAELDEHLERMYVAMKAGAYFPPIDVSVIDGRIIARDGHCRTRTAKRLKKEGVDIMLEARQFRGNEAECVFHMISSSQGKPLTPLESGRGYLRLIRYGLEIPAICARTGVSRTTVENGLILAEAPVAIQQMIVKGEVSAHVAIDMIRKHGSKATEVLRAKSCARLSTKQRPAASRKLRKSTSPARVFLRVWSSRLLPRPHRCISMFAMTSAKAS